MKIQKKSTQCQECGKSVSHHADNPAYELCSHCRNRLENDTISLYIWYKFVGIVDNILLNEINSRLGIEK